MAVCEYCKAEFEPRDKRFARYCCQSHARFGRYHPEGERLFEFSPTRFGPIDKFLPPNVKLTDEDYRRIEVAAELGTSRAYVMGLLAGLRRRDIQESESAEPSQGELIMRASRFA